MTDIDVGDSAPTIELIDDSGKPWSTTGHRGRHVVLIFPTPTPAHRSTT